MLLKVKLWKEGDDSKATITQGYINHNLRVDAYILILIRQGGQVNVNLGAVQCEQWPSQGGCVLDYTDHIISFNFRNLYQVDKEFFIRKCREQTIILLKDIWNETYKTLKGTACQSIFTSNQTEVVSLPVNKYCPTNNVAPGVTACKEQSFFLFVFSSVWCGNKTRLTKNLNLVVRAWSTSIGY